MRLLAVANDGGAAHRRCGGRALSVFRSRRRGCDAGRSKLRARQTHGVALDAVLHDVLDELEELGRATDGVGDGRRLEQILLGELGAEISTRLQPIDACRCRR